MSIEEKLITIAENQEKVFESGKKAEYDRFWDSFQQNGNLKSYGYAFSGNAWNDENFKPKYDIVPTTAAHMFYNSKITNLKQRLIDCNVVLNTDSAANLYYFGAGSTITHCPEIGNKNVMNAQNCFNGNDYIETIDKITVGDGCTMVNCLAWGTKLKNIKFCENFAGMSLNLQKHTLLTKESLLNLVNNLADKSNDTSGIDWAVTLGQTNLAKLTDEEKAIATEKGWTLA